MSNTENPNTPTHIAYQVREFGQKSYWSRIGAAFTHKDGKGFNIVLDSLPVDGKVTLRMAAEKVSEQQE